MNTVVTSEIKTGELTFHWVTGYYDGVLSGFASWQGRLCYFEISEDTATNRRFSIHSLSDEEVLNAIQENEEFKARHGNHNDLLPDGSSAGGKCITTLKDAAAMGYEIASAMAADTWQPSDSYRLNPVIGWFTSTTF
ncbi:hypothetical protein GCM10023213_00290 [Prosthecobacter algae]|uniref:Uncharacterized protein n=1 Tax=Prosthecobacter algae TaxID=1144682 RepID=A0ABP9NS16_9BACT